MMEPEPDEFYADMMAMRMGDPVVQAAARRQQYLDYRRAHRPFRSAFRGGMVAGERQRRIMGALGIAMRGDR